MNAEQDPKLVHRVTKQNATEPPFANAYWDNKEPGLYVDPYSGEVLFASIHKYDSGSGWPSFYRAIGRVTHHDDSSLGMRRIELRSSSSDSHLGHVFDDGPAPTGQRYCINSAALRFVGAQDLTSRSDDYRILFAQPPQKIASSLFATAIFAGGCFWCTEAAFSKVEGVVKVWSGYTGGQVENPDYEQVCGGNTGHYEAIMLLYQVAVVSYESLLERFWRQIDPTDANGQFADRGSQYQTAIFYHNQEQRKLAEQSRKNLEATFGNIATELLPEQTFYIAEDYHQAYAAKQPQRYRAYAGPRNRLLRSVWQNRA